MKPTNEFERASQAGPECGIFRELWLFLRHNKKWWMLPILMVLGMFGLLMLASGSGAAPFIYTLF
ncbi:MAG: DUF5989 family protein [Planctomycetes bacterium]|nr:DUF5989 family protein [Planctomycetota bacterium]